MPPVSYCAGLILIIAALPAVADDVRVQLSSNDAFVVLDGTGTTERLRLDEATGDVHRNGVRFLHTSGGTSLFLGPGAGAVSTGSNNAAFGTGALASTTGNENSAFGANALTSFSTANFGGLNAAFGASALTSTTTGPFNSAFGARALRQNTTGGGNSAFGTTALLDNTTGENNVAVGRDALWRLDPGDRNIAIGFGAGSSLFTGDDNIYLGHSGAPSESGQIRIGTTGTHTATYLAGDTSTTGTLGVGTTAPDRELTVDDVDGTGDTALNLKATGRELLVAVNQSTGGVISMQTNHTLDLRTNGTSRLRITAGGRVGIGGIAASHPLEVGSDATNGNGAHLTAGGTWTNGSSRAFKRDFEAVDAQAILDRVAALPITRWRYRGSEEGEHLGPVAEDFHAAFGLGGDDRYIATVDAEGVALAAIQALHALALEQQRQLVALRDLPDLVAAQRAELARLRDRVAELEAPR